MRKESHSHYAYQDFIREKVAPVTLLTENSRTQTGKKWTETNRRNMTRQRHIALHNQNQNESEIFIVTVKRRTVLTMRYANAPLVFWCITCILLCRAWITLRRKDLDIEHQWRKWAVIHLTFWCSNSCSRNPIGITNQQQNTQNRTSSQWDTSALHGNMEMYSLIKYGRHLMENRKMVVNW